MTTQTGGRESVNIRSVKSGNQVQTCKLIIAASETCGYNCLYHFYLSINILVDKCTDKQILAYTTNVMMKKFVIQ